MFIPVSVSIFLNISSSAAVNIIGANVSLVELPSPDLDLSAQCFCSHLCSATSVGFLLDFDVFISYGLLFKCLKLCLIESEAFS